MKMKKNMKMRINENTEIQEKSPFYNCNIRKIHSCIILCLFGELELG